MIDYVYIARPTNIVDGDTVDFEIDLGFYLKINIRVRLADVDCYEKYDKTDRLRRLAALEKTHCERLLEQHEHVYIKTNKTGKFGRWIGTIMLPGNDRTLNELMVEYHKVIENYE